MAQAAGAKLNNTTAGAEWVQNGAILRGTWRFPEPLTAVRARWESGSLSTVLAHCILEPRKVCDRLSYPKTALPGTPNGRGWESATHALTCNTCTLDMLHSLTCVHAHTAWLTLSHAMGAHMQHAFMFNMHTTHSHTTYSSTRHSPLHMSMCSNACSHTHTLLLHTRSYSHVHTHGCMDGHTPTQTHTHAPMCPSKMLTHIHAQIEKDTQGHRETCPDPDPATPMTTSQRQKDNTERHTHKESHPVSHVDSPCKAVMHAEKDTRRPKPATHTWLDAYKGTGTHTQSQPPALMPTGPPHRWHVLALTLGRGVQTQAAVPSFQPQPGSLSPLQGPVTQHHRQVKSECAKIKPKGCDKAVPFPQDSALTQVLLSAINIFILILKDISITSLALQPARRYLACWATRRPYWAARGRTQGSRPYALRLQVTRHEGC